jgi:hypothetical protein
LIVKQGLTSCPQVGESMPPGATYHVGGSALTSVTIPKKRSTHVTLNVPNAMANSRRSFAIVFIYIQYCVSEKAGTEWVRLARWMPSSVLHKAVTLSITCVTEPLNHIWVLCMPRKSFGIPPSDHTLECNCIQKSLPGRQLAPVWMSAGGCWWAQPQ